MTKELEDQLMESIEMDQAERIAQLEGLTKAVDHEANQILKERARRLTLQEKVVEIGNILTDSQQEAKDIRSKVDQLEAENARLREALRDIIDWRDNNVCTLRGLDMDIPDRHLDDARKALDHSGDANKMVVGKEEA